MRRPDVSGDKQACGLKLGAALRSGFSNLVQASRVPGGSTWGNVKNYESDMERLVNGLNLTTWERLGEEGREQLLWTTGAMKASLTALTKCFKSRSGLAALHPFSEEEGQVMLVDVDEDVACICAPRAEANKALKAWSNTDVGVVVITWWNAQEKKEDFAIALNNNFAYHRLGIEYHRSLSLPGSTGATRMGKLKKGLSLVDGMTDALAVPGEMEVRKIKPKEEDVIGMPFGAVENIQKLLPGAVVVQVRHPNGNPAAGALCSVTWLMFVYHNMFTPKLIPTAVEDVTGMNKTDSTDVPLAVKAESLLPKRQRSERDKEKKEKLRRAAEAQDLLFGMPKPWPLERTAKLLRNVEKGRKTHPFAAGSAFESSQEAKSRMASVQEQEQKRVVIKDSKGYRFAWRCALHEGCAFNVNLNFGIKNKIWMVRRALFYAGCLPGQNVMVAGALCGLRCRVGQTQNIRVLSCRARARKRGPRPPTRLLHRHNYSRSWKVQSAKAIMKLRRTWRKLHSRNTHPLQRKRDGWTT